MASIEIENASVTYFMRKPLQGGVEANQGSLGARIVVGQRYLEVQALKDISLSFKTGDRVGLIGVNGSGKSTLLKLCAGALAVQSGSITIKGRVSPQFALGAGLQAELSGRQNTELKSLYMGVPQSSIAEHIEEVKALSELGAYFELPIKSYSAGMKSRLVMSLMRLVRGDILIMDEWVNAADASVNITANKLQADLIDNAKILLLASHSKRVLHSWTQTLVWLDRGEIREVGPVGKVYAAYQSHIKG